MKKTLIKFSTLLVIFCILYNYQILNSIFSAEIAFGDFEKNDDKEPEKQSLQLICLSKYLNFPKIKITDIYNKKIYSGNKFSASLNTPPPNFYSANSG